MKDLEPEFRELVPKYNAAVKDELLRMVGGRGCG